MALPRGGSTRAATLVPVVVKEADPDATWSNSGGGGCLTVRIGRAVVEVREPERLDWVWLARFVSEIGGAL